MLGIFMSVPDQMHFMSTKNCPRVMYGLERNDGSVIYAMPRRPFHTPFTDPYAMVSSRIAVGKWDSLEPEIFALRTTPMMPINSLFVSTGRRLGPSSNVASCKMDSRHKMYNLVGYLDEVRAFNDEVYRELNPGVVGDFETNFYNNCGNMPYTARMSLKVKDMMTMSYDPAIAALSLAVDTVSWINTNMMPGQILNKGNMYVTDTSRIERVVKYLTHGIKRTTEIPAERAFASVVLEHNPGSRLHILGLDMDGELYEGRLDNRLKTSDPIKIRRHSRLKSAFSDEAVDYLMTTIIRERISDE